MKLLHYLLCYWVTPHLWFYASAMPVRSFLRPFVRYQTCDILKTNEPILMHIGTSGPTGKGHETINFCASEGQES